MSVYRDLQSVVFWGLVIIIGILFLSSIQHVGQAVVSNRGSSLPVQSTPAQSVWQRTPAEAAREARISSTSSSLANGAEQVSAAFGERVQDSIGSAVRRGLANVLASWLADLRATP